VLALPDVALFDVALTWQVFSGGPDHGDYRYEVRICGVAPGPVRSSAGVSIEVEHGLEALQDADTVVVTGSDPIPQAAPGAVLDALRACAAAGARLMSVCTGAFVLAETGLLDGRCVSTHWRHAAELARRFPAVRVDPDVLFVDDGMLLSSAGVAAGIDLCLHVVRRDHGAHVANSAARRTVVAAHRDGGQAQYLDAPVPADDHAGLAGIRSWMLEHLGQPHTLDQLARRAGYSRRTFTRRVRAETGKGVASWVLDQRIDRARQLLEVTDDPVERVAQACGFGWTAEITGMAGVADLRARVHARDGLKLATLKIRAENPPRVLPPRDGSYVKNRFRAALGHAPI